MKSKFKSLFKSLVFWAAFFCLLISIIFFVCLISYHYFALDEYYSGLISKLLDAIWNLFIVTYVIFAVLTLINRFPERLKRFEKFKYLLVLFFVLLVEMTMIALSLPDLD